MKIQTKKSSLPSISQAEFLQDISAGRTNFSGLNIFRSNKVTMQQFWDALDGQLNQIDFSGSIIGMALTKMTLRECNLNTAILPSSFPKKGASFIDCDCVGLQASGGNFRETTFNNTILTGACFYMADISGATFLNCPMREIDLRRTYASKTTIVDGCDTCGANVEHMYFLSSNAFRPMTPSHIISSCSNQQGRTL